MNTQSSSQSNPNVNNSYYTPNYKVLNKDVYANSLRKMNMFGRLNAYAFLVNIVLSLSIFCAAKVQHIDIFELLGSNTCIALVPVILYIAEFIYSGIHWGKSKFISGSKIKQVYYVSLVDRDGFPKVYSDVEVLDMIKDYSVEVHTKYALHCNLWIMTIFVNVIVFIPLLIQIING